MATDPSDYDDILKRFDKLNWEERQALLDELVNRQVTATNGDNSGRTLFDALNERGMAGSIKNAPTDWSSSPKYLEGLGKHDE